MEKIKLTHLGRAIETRFFGATNYRQARIKAIDGDRSATVPYEYGVGQEEAHWQAVKELLKKYGYEWGDEWVVTSIEQGKGYIFAPMMMRRRMDDSYD